MRTAQDYLPTSYWLMKTEPNVFSIDDLVARQSEPWDGVRNFQARNFMRDHMSVGDKILFYHSGIPDPGIVGVAEVVARAKPDVSAWDKTSEYYDPKSDPNKPTWYLVTVGLAKKFLVPVTLGQIKSEPELEEMLVARKGQRLSVQPVSEQEFNKILLMTQRTELN